MHSPTSAIDPHNIRTLDLPILNTVLSREPFPAEFEEETGRVAVDEEEGVEEVVMVGGAGAGTWGGEEGVMRTGDELELSLGMGMESAPERECVCENNDRDENEKVGREAVVNMLPPQVMCT